MICFFESFCALASVMVLIDRVATLLLVLSSFPSVGITLSGVFASCLLGGERRHSYILCLFIKFL